MAITISQVRAITHDLVIEGMKESVFNSAALFRVLYDKREKKSGGNNIGAAVVIDGQLDATTGEWYSGASDLVGAEKSDITRAVVDWKQAHETILLSKLDIMKNNGVAQILNLMTEKVDVAKSRFKARLSAGVHSDGSNALAFGGIRQFVTATGDYAGLAVGDIVDSEGNDAWLAYVGTLTGALTEAKMQLAKGKASQDLECPTAAFMQQNVYNEVWGVLQEHQRILAKESDLSGLGHDQKKVLMYNGIPHYIDSYTEAAALVYLNTDFTKLYVHTMEDMVSQSFDKLEDNNAVKNRMLITGNVLCSKRNRNSKLTGITVVA
jgi:hypothetical protein